MKEACKELAFIRSKNIQRRYEHLNIRAEAAVMNDKQKAKLYIKLFIHIERYEPLFSIIRPHFNPKPSSSLFKLKIPNDTNYDFMNIPKNNKLV